MANGDMMQGIMTRMSRDQAMVDGIINMAAQDSMMHGHLMEMMKSMQTMRR